jgi:anti-sigma B factor antagonist
MFAINQRTLGEVTILDLAGRITIGEGTLAFREAIRRLVEQGRRKIILNFADVTHIDSSGIGELISAYTTLNNKEGKVLLLNLPPSIVDVLKITKLLTIFEVFEDETRAVESFS